MFWCRLCCSCDSWVLLQSAAACRPDTAAQPPAAALQDRKTRAAENQHQRRETGDCSDYTHSAAAGCHGCPRPADLGRGVGPGWPRCTSCRGVWPRDSAGRGHAGLQPPASEVMLLHLLFCSESDETDTAIIALTIFTVSTPPTECLGWPRHV